ncbi:MAG: precorrin-4 C(11)-methyltransferase [Desulfobacteraceae bacterium]|nr:precorrin-4 C(11)-methyltransferase [Desulfobacteraceae bacterium]
MKTNEPNPVLFVGAGPGDPELITVKGQKALEKADCVIYAGSLVPKAVLKWTKPGAILLDSAGMHLMRIVEEMATHHKNGKSVVRLHTGDPSLYGAVFEQMAQLTELAIPYGVIPGVTAAFAAAAAMGIEYTLPEISQTLILTRMAGRTPVPELENMASLAAHQTSMAIYLSISLVDELETILTRAYGPENLCAVVYRASHPEEKVIYATVGELAETVRQEKITRQALIIVGKVLNISPERLQHKSKLYDKHFSHGFRNATTGGA